MNNPNMDNNPTRTQEPAVQPTPSPDSSTALLAELQKITAGMEANRQSIEAGFERIAEELNAAELTSDRLEEPEAIMVTPAAIDQDAVRNGDQPASKARTSNAPDVEFSRSRRPKQRDDESKDDFLDRIRNLPPIGSKRRGYMEPRSLFEARRHDGTTDE